MIHLTYNEIRSLCGDRLFRQGFLIYQKQKINDLMQIDSTIKASVEDKTDELVTIEFSSHTGNLIDFNCTCHSSLHSDEPCLHIVGVLLKILYSKESLFKSLQNSNNETLLKEFESLVRYSKEPNLKNQKLLNFEVTIEPKTTDRILLSFRIGLEKLYVIQDLKEFIAAIGTRSPIIFSKTFSYLPEVHSFSDKAQRIIDIITDYYYSLESSKASSISSVDNLKNTLMLPDHLLLKVLRLLSDQSYNLRYNGLTLYNQTMKKKLSIGFDITETNTNIKINTERFSHFLFLTKNKEFLYLNDALYHLSTRDIKSIKTINKYLINNEISLNKIYSDRIFSSILPTLNNIGEATIDESITERFFREELSAVFYIDKFNDSLKATLSFFYGEFEIGIYPALKPQIDEGLILIRDLETESKILDILKESNYMVSEDQSYFTFDDNDQLYDFIFYYLPELSEYANIYYSEAFKSLHIQTKNTISTAVRLNDNTNILEFSFDFGGVEKSELKDLLKTIKLRKKYYKLKNGSFMQLDSSVSHNLLNLLDTLNISSKDFEKGVVEIPKYRAIIIDELLRNDTVINFKKNRSFSKLVKDIKNFSKIDYEIPQLENATLRDYQKIGFSWLKTLTSYGFGGILADDMGLGKTIQAISLIKSCKSPLPSIVIAPTSLIYNWEDEISKFAPDLKTCLIVGTKKDREVALDTIEDYDIVITSYGLAKRDIESYIAHSFEFCIIDEAQHIKNPLSLNAKSVKLVKARSRFALTGTPIENSLTELWSIFDFIMPGFLHSHHQFSSKFEKPIIKNNDIDTINRLTTTIEPFILRRLKKDVLSELPQKIETKVTTELFDSQKKLYLAYLDQAKEELRSSLKGSQNNTIKILSILTRLRQICCHPSMFVSDYTEGSAKLDLLEELVLDAIESGHRILIFSQFTTMLDIIKEMLGKNNLSYFYIDGAVNPKDRLDMVNRFNGGENDIFLISLKAGGTGLNLTGADTVIHFDPWWNPATEEQATDRVYRIGQEKPVQVFKLITTGTIEEKIYRLQQTKKSLIESIIKPGETFISSFSEDEILSLLDYH